MMPQRIQLRRTKGWRKPHGAIVVARPSPWGNPYQVDDYRDDWPDADERELRRMAVSDYRGWIERRRERDDQSEPPTLSAIREHLAGHDLACWCPLPEPGQTDVCHAAVLLELANTPRAASEPEEWPSGVWTQCERCERDALCQGVRDANDPLDDVAEWVCRPCYIGEDWDELDEDDEPCRPAAPPDAEQPPARTPGTPKPSAAATAPSRSTP